MNNSQGSTQPPEDDTPQRNKHAEEDLPVTPRLIATAYHEAGHAVMALLVGRPVHKVTISPGQMQTGGVRLGACQMKKGRLKSPKDWLEDEVLILLSGMVAEAQFTGEYCAGGAKQDLLAVRRLLTTRARSERQLERLQQRMLDKTEHELSDERIAKVITRVAEELLARQSISGRSVQHIYEQVSQ